MDSVQRVTDATLLSKKCWVLYDAQVPVSLRMPGNGAHRQFREVPREKSAEQNSLSNRCPVSTS